jgi:hypothetical protein
MHSRSSAGHDPPDILFSENADGTGLRNHLLCVPMLRCERVPSELPTVLIANHQKRRRLRHPIYYLATGGSSLAAGGKGRLTERKAIVAVAVEVKEKGYGRVRLRHIPM